MRLLNLVVAFLPNLLFSQPVFQHLFPLNGKEVTINAIRSAQGGQMAIGGRLIDEQNGQNIGFVATVAASGDLLWTRAFPSNENTLVWDCLPTPEGRFIAALTTDPLSDEGELIWFDASGQMVLRRRSNASQTTFFRIYRLTDGNIIAVGKGPAGPVNTGGLLMKLNTNGQVLWSKVCTGNDGPMEFRDVYEDEQGFLYVAGVQFIQGTSGQAVFGRFASDGTPEWLRRPGFSSENRFFRIVPFDGGTSLLMGGHTQSNNGFVAVWLCNVRPDGTVKWMNTYGETDTHLFLYDLVKAPGVAFFTFMEQGGNANTGLGVGRINTSGDLLSVRNYDPSGKRGGTPHVALTTQNELLLADGVLDGQGRSLYIARTDMFGNVPPCCLLSGNLQVNAVSQESVFPNFQTVNGPGLVNVTQLPAILDFETFTDLCPDVNTDFTLSDTLVCPGECITITLTNPTPGAEYTWLTPGGTPDPQDPLKICYFSEGMFGVVPVVNGCAQNPASKTIEVSTAGNDNVPTAFTPDGDGTNDVFRPLIVCPVTDYRFEVYNRWGQKVFETTDPNDAWDGRTDDNTPAVSDVFVWNLSYRSITGEASERKGQVTLVR